MGPPGPDLLFPALGWFNPKDYGAKFDGMTDDLPAMIATSAAMPLTGGVIAIPPGTAWLSSTWHPDRSCRIVGCGGQGTFASNQTEGQATSGFTVAPGHSAIGLDFSSVFGGAADATGSIVEDLDLVSTVMVPQNITNGDLGNGIQRYDSRFYSTANVRVGECFVRSDNSIKTVFFRASSMISNAGRGPTPKLNTDPPGWSDVLLSTYTDPSGVTWTTESFPSTWTSNTSYLAGQRVMAPDDNRYVFRSVVGGVSASSPVSQLVGGDQAHGITIGATFLDGSVTWITEFCPGIYTNCPRVVFRRLYVRRFLGAAFAFVGGAGMWATAIGGTAADESSCQDCDTDWCGLGVQTQGDDSNIILVSNLNVLHAGMLFPFRHNGFDPGVGGHGVHMASLGPMTIVSMTIQASSGRPLLKRGDGSVNLISCHSEIGETALDSNGAGSIVSVGSDFPWPADQGNIIILDGGQNASRGFTSVDQNTTPHISASLAENNGATLLSFGKVGASDQAFWGTTLNFQVPVGYWGKQYLTSGGVITNAYLLSNSDASGSSGKPGPGWLTFPEGYFVGNPSSSPSPLFVGHTGAETDKVMRAGERLKGDRFFSGPNTRTLTSNGYRGIPWNTFFGSTPTSIFAYNPATGFAGLMIEPTTNTGTTRGGERVFRCTTSGTTSGSEPNWPTALNATIADGTAVWTLVGFTPSVATDGELAAAPNTVVDNLRIDASTSTSASNQVLCSYTVDSPTSGQMISVIIDLIITGGNAVAGTGSAKLSGTFSVSSTGTLTRIGSDDNAVKGMNGAAFAIDISTPNIIRLEVTPGSAVNNAWHISLRAQRGLNITS